MVLIDQLIAWSIGNPGKPWTNAAAAFKLSNIFVRAVVASDAFRARYQEVRDRTLQEVGIFTLKEKIAAAADIAIERLAEKVVLTESMSDLTDATEMLLSHTYGKPGGGGSGVGIGSPASVQYIQVHQAIIDGRNSILGVAGEQEAGTQARAPALSLLSPATPPYTEAGATHDAADSRPLSALETEATLQEQHS
jgi:hypothetical protein